MDDRRAYELYPHHRKWFNKLWFSESMQYNCGPSGTFPNVDGWYIVRPIMNLSGMSVGARKQYISAYDKTQVEPGYFWCEWFEDVQYSVTYKNVNGKWVQSSCWRADRNCDQLYKFKRWFRYDHQIFSLPKFFDELLDLDLINVEFVGKNPIEVHLRESPDPKYDEFIPVWKGEKELVDKYKRMGYSYTESYDDADGFLKQPRVGFLVK